MTPRFLETPVVLALQKTALAHGGKISTDSGITVSWDIAGNCESPVPVELKGRQALHSRGMRTISSHNPASKPRFVDLSVRCRKCRTCLAFKSREWKLRARAEYGQSVRTWLCTLTLNPQAHTTMLYRAALRLSKAGVKIDALSDAEQFAERETESYRELVKWMKRLRKNTGVQLRFLAITEKHKSGLPHYHVLLHEQDPEGPVRYKDLKGKWPLGFGHYKLVADARGAAYVCKYLAKSPQARVRASAHYGSAVAAALPTNSPKPTVPRVAGIPAVEKKPPPQVPTGMLRKQSERS